MPWQGFVKRRGSANFGQSVEGICFIESHKREKEELPGRASRCRLYYDTYCVGKCFV